jgi:hypothetical protein
MSSVPVLVAKLKQEVQTRNVHIDRALTGVRRQNLLIVDLIDQLETAMATTAVVQPSRGDDFNPYSLAPQQRGIVLDVDAAAKGFR